jgi:hypothetical protein
MATQNIAAIGKHWDFSSETVLSDCYGFSIH